MLSTYKTSSLHCYKQRDHLWRNRSSIHWTCIQGTWATPRSYLRSRTPICFVVHDFPIPHTGNWVQQVNCISPPDWWTNSTNQPGNWEVPPNLYQLQARWLGYMAGNCTILLQRQSPFSHWPVPILLESWSTPLERNWALTRWDTESTSRRIW